MTTIMPDSRTHCSIVVEDNFGPIVAGTCLGGFDFTLLFEEAILTILPLGIASELPLLSKYAHCLLSYLLGIWALLRIRVLVRQTSKVQPSWLLPIKMVCVIPHRFGFHRVKTCLALL